MLSLIFFAFLASSCKEKENKQIRLIWKNNRAVSLEIPIHLLKEGDRDSIRKYTEVRLAEENSPPIMGNYELLDDVVLFTPLIPFSRGLSYRIIYKNRGVAILTVLHEDTGNPPQLTAIYPSSDSLPENLLKFYFQFSTPMRTGQSLQHVMLLDANNDTLRNIFLDLQPELWNKDNTVLTLWLDPGRIKRDLIPNQQMGNPLQKGKRYKLRVAATWKDVQDRNLKHEVEKQFVVTLRDEQSPGPARWNLVPPRTGSRDPLTILFNEALDYFLLLETTKLYDANGNLIKGKLKILEEEKGMQFMPEDVWQAGRHKIEVTPHLEDLAGNNLEKLFDRDLRDTRPGVQKRERYFTLNPARE
jgi:hypothetical protein